MPAKLRRLVFPLFVIIASCVLSIGYLQILSKWWFQDDPHQYFYVVNIHDPLAIFLNPEVLRGFGVGNALVPLQLLSYWIDVHLFGAHPLPAYMHNTVSFVAASLLLYTVVKGWADNEHLALATTLVWMLLPSTIAVHYFIATRHYMEGLVFALGMMIGLQQLRDMKPGRRPLLLFTIGSLGFLAMLCKEIYATVIPVILAYYSLKERRITLALLAVVLSAGYAGYRAVFLGVDLSYTYPYVVGMEYVYFLSVLPIMFTGSSTGYIFYAAFLFLTVWFVWTRPFSWTNPAILFVSLVGVSLVAIYPVTFALLRTYQVPGPWYRATFLLNSILLVWGVYTLQFAKHQAIRIAVIGICVCLLLPSAEHTRQYWTNAMARAKAEGLFYLTYPDRLLYSEEEASWFIVGVHELYNVPVRHYINRQYHTDSVARDAVQRYDTIWRYHQGDFIPDEQLFEAIRRENN